MMELFSTVIRLSIIVGYVAGNIAILLIVIHAIRLQHKAFRCLFKFILTIFTIFIVNFPLLFYLSMDLWNITSRLTLLHYVPLGLAEARQLT